MTTGIKMDARQRNLIIVFGLLASVMFNSIPILTFYLAYFNDGASTVTVNNFGEANIEAFVVFPCEFIFLCWCLYLSMKGLKEESKEKAKLAASKKRILQSCERAHYMNASPVVFHAGFYQGREKKKFTR
jgi:hypothetical protein